MTLIAPSSKRQVVRFDCARSIVCIAGALAALFAPELVSAQCADWKVGPLDNGTAPNGVINGVLVGAITASTLWDPDGAGPQEAILVVGGYFTSIEGVPASNIAARDPATGQWKAIGNGLNDAVNSLAVYNGDLIVGGFFTSGVGQPGDYIARWDGSSWHSLGGGVGCACPASWVTSLGLHNGQLIVGGYFESAGGQPASNIARWDGTSWHPMGSGSRDAVSALTPFQGDLIASGSYTSIDGQEITGVARWNGNSWQTLGGMPNNVQQVLAFAIYNGQLVIGGYLGLPQPTSHVARWSGSSWVPMGAGIDDGVYCLGIYNNELYAGGNFQHADGQPASAVAHWNGVSWQPAGSGVQNGSTVYSLTAYNGELVVGGSFNSAGGHLANHIARWNGYVWSPFGGGWVSSVLAMTNHLGHVVAGGNFQQSSSTGQSANYVVSWNGATLSSLGEGMDNPVFALKAYRTPGIGGSNQIVAGGSFTHAGGVTANFVALWDEPSIAIPPPQWLAMGAGFSGPVGAIERFNNATYAGGNFLVSGSTSVNRIARWNGSTWDPLGSGMNGPVFALKAYNGYLYAGGAFTTAGGVSTGGLARWDGSAWSQVGGFFGPNGIVYALEVHNGVLVMAGSFAGFGGSPNISSWNGSNYTNLGTGGTDAPVRSLRSTGPRLYVGGDFTTAGGVAALRIAYWDGAWYEPAGGADNTVDALVWYHDEMHSGGTFQTVGSGAIASTGWGEYLETGVPWIVQSPLSQTAQSGNDISFGVQGASGYGESRQWYRNGAPLSDGPTGTGSTVNGAGTDVLSVANVSPADAGFYQVALTNACGSDTSVAAILTVDGVSAVPTPGSNGAAVFEALGPNPSLGAARLRFTLGRDARVSVQVLDVGGRRVRIVDAGSLPAGRHELTWDGRDGDGRSVRSGLYFVVLEAEGTRLGVRRLAIQR